MRFVDDVNALFESLVQRIRMVAARGVVGRVDDGKKMQALQLALLADEAQDGVERFQQYGFTGVPLAGAEALVVFLGGNRDHGIVLAVDDRRYRIKGLEDGEVALYTHEDQGDDKHRVILRKDRKVEVHGAQILINADAGEGGGDGVVRIEADGVEIHGRKYVQTDVHGKGSRETHVGGNAYEVDSYVQGSVVTTTEHGLDQEDIPSDHPDGPDAG